MGKAIVRTRGGRTLPEYCSAIVLAGGLGSRLRPAYSKGPKSMAPIAGRPFLEYLVVRLRSVGIRDIILCVGYKRSQIKRWFGHGKKWGVRITYSTEEKPLGTAGALRNAGRFISSSSFFVLNGDSLLDVDLAEMLTFHQRRQAQATIALTRSRIPGRYGAVCIERSGRIAAFREKQESSTKAPRKRWINAGVYLLKKELLGRLPRATPSSLETDVFPALAGGRIFGFRTEGYFIDIGIPADYRRAQKELVRGYPHVHSC